MTEIFARLIEALPSLLGAIVGGAASIGTVLASQRMTASREQQERERYEKRVSALFVTHIKSIIIVLEQQTESGESIGNREMLKSRIKKLHSIIDQPPLMLSLNPEVIEKLPSAMRTLAVAMHIADKEEYK